MDEITQEERDEWKQIFDDFDTDRNGQLSKEDAKDAMRCCHKNPVDGDIDNMFKEMDKNADDKIDFEEFCIFMQKQPNGEESMREALAVFEENGKLGREKLKEILGADDKEADELLEAADLNHDGFIDQEEFISLIQYKVDNA